MQARDTNETYAGGIVREYRGSKDGSSVMVEGWRKSTMQVGLERIIASSGQTNI